MGKCENTRTEFHVTSNSEFPTAPILPPLPILSCLYRFYPILISTAYAYSAQRKMMSLAMLACRTGSPSSLLPETFGPKKIHIPKAPPLGLLLQQPQFKIYNDRLKAGVGSNIGDDRIPLTWKEYEEEMEEFKVKWIYEKLREEELNNNIFHKWIRQVDCSTTQMFSFLK